MQKGIKKAHPLQPVSRGREQRDAQIDAADRSGDLPDLGQDLLRPVRRFRAEKLHAANAQSGQNGDGDGDNPDAAHPLQQRAPGQQSRRRLAEIGDDRRTRRGDPRNGFEKRIGDVAAGRPERGKIERHRA